MHAFVRDFNSTFFHSDTRWDVNLTYNVQLNNAVYDSFKLGALSFNLQPPVEFFPLNSGLNYTIASQQLVTNVIDIGDIIGSYINSSESILTCETSMNTKSSTEMPVNNETLIKSIPEINISERIMSQEIYNTILDLVC